MQDLQRTGSGFDGIITSLANEKLREVSTACKGIFMSTFLSEGYNGLIDDIEIIFIDKTDPSEPTRREQFWRTKLKTLASYGLDVEE